jgi:hypothetical protein
MADKGFQCPIGIDSALIARIDERTATMSKDVSAIFARLDTLDRTFVTRHEFSPVQRITYGLVAVVLLTVAGALVATVVM